MKVEVKLAFPANLVGESVTWYWEVGGVRHAGQIDVSILIEGHAGRRIVAAATEIREKKKVRARWIKLGDKGVTAGIRVPTGIEWLISISRRELARERITRNINIAARIQNDAPRCFVAQPTKESRIG